MLKKNQAKILVVTDDYKNHETIRLGLETLGHQVIGADNGQEAYAGTLKEKPDLIISDYLLSDFTGCELLKKIRQMPWGKDIPFLFLSDKPAVDDKTNIFSLQGCSFILKPVDVNDLGNCVCGLLKRKRGIIHGRLVSSCRLHLQVDAYKGQISSGSRILDFGCGNGAVSIAIARQFQAAVAGADIQDFLHYNLPFFLSRDRRLSDIFGYKSFDIVIMNDMLHHICGDRQLSYIQEAKRIGKKVLIVETYPTRLAKFLDILMNYIVYLGKETTPLSHRTPQQWEALIKSLDSPYSIKILKSPFYYPLRHFIIGITT